jgi:hypothetical protein
VARLRVPPIVGAALLACDRLPAAAGAGGRIRDGLTAARFKPGDPSGREA